MNAMIIQAAFRKYKVSCAVDPPISGRGAILLTDDPQCVLFQVSVCLAPVLSDLRVHSRDTLPPFFRCFLQEYKKQKH